MQRPANRSQEQRHQGRFDLSTVVLLVAVGLLFSAVMRYRHALRSSSEILAVQFLETRRTRALDGLIGSRLPYLELETAEGRSELLWTPGTEELLWVIDVAACLNCLQSLRAWNKFASTPGRSGSVVFSGATKDEVRVLVAQSGILGRVLVDLYSSVPAALELPFPSTKLFAGVDGVILAVDTRNLGGSCSWSFEGQLGRLRYGDLSAMIREREPVATAEEG